MRPFYVFVERFCRISLNLSDVDEHNTLLVVMYLLKWILQKYFIIIIIIDVTSGHAFIYYLLIT